MTAFYYQGELNLKEIIILSETESLHCIKVLRLRNGDQVEIMNGMGKIFKGTIIKQDKKQVQVELFEAKDIIKRDYYLHVAIAPTKNIDRIEWFVEKAVEIGIDRITFITSRYSERKNIRLERIIKRAVSALKQSGNAVLPEFSNVTPFKKIIEATDEKEKFLAYEQTQSNKNLFSSATLNSSYLVLIGPEGGFSEEEIALAKQKEFNLVSLGENRFRTETAGITTCYTMNVKHNSTAKLGKQLN